MFNENDVEDTCGNGDGGPPEPNPYGNEAALQYCVAIVYFRRDSVRRYMKINDDNVEPM